MYEAIVLIHVVAILVFAGAHLVSGVAIFQARSEGDRGRLTAVLGRSRQALMVAFIALLVSLIAGVVLAFLGEWWGRLWIWASIGLIVVVGGLMTPMAAIPMNQLRGSARHAGRQARGRRGGAGSPGRRDRRGRPGEAPARGGRGDRRRRLPRDRLADGVEALLVREIDEPVQLAGPRPAPSAHGARHPRTRALIRRRDRGPSPTRGPRRGRRRP
jgi:hypothetical protein